MAKVLILGGIYTKIEWYDKAMDAYTKINHNNLFDTKISNIYNNKAIKFKNDKKYQEAITAYINAIIYNSSNVNIRHDVYVILEPQLNKYNDDLYEVVQESKYHSIIEVYKKAIKENPNELVFYRLLGNIYSNYEEYTKEINTYKKALQNNKISGSQSGIVDIYKRIKSIYAYYAYLDYEQGEYDNAIKSYRHSINHSISYNKYLNYDNRKKLNFFKAESYIEIGDIYFEQKNILKL